MLFILLKIKFDYAIIINLKFCIVKVSKTEVMQPLLKCPKSRMQNKIQTMSYKLFSSENTLINFCAIIIYMIICSIK